MKSMLLTATAVGAAIAGLMLYYQRKNSSKNKLSGTTTDAYNTVNNAMSNIARPPHHAMG